MGKIIADSSCIDNRYIYFTCSNLNIIGQIDCSTGQITYIMGPSNEPLCYEHLYDGIQIIDDELFVFPYNAKSGYSYFIKEKKWRRIEGGFDCQENGKQQSCGSVVFGGRIYIISYLYGDIVCYDTKSRQYSFPFNIRERLGARPSFGGQSIARVGNTIYVANQNSNSVIKCNMETEEVSFVEIKGSNSFIGTYYDGEYIWIVPKSSSNKLVRWREKDDYIKLFEIPSRNYIWGLVPYDRNVLIYGYYENTYIYDTETETFKIMEETIYRAHRFDDKLIMSTTNSDVILYQESKRQSTIHIDNDMVEKCYRGNRKMIANSLGGSIINEGIGLLLTDYLWFISG